MGVRNHGPAAFSKRLIASPPIPCPVSSHVPSHPLTLYPFLQGEKFEMDVEVISALEMKIDDLMQGEFASAEERVS